MAGIVCFCPSKKDFLPEANHCKLNTSLRGEIHAGFTRFTHWKCSALIGSITRFQTFNFLVTTLDCMVLMSKGKIYTEIEPIFNLNRHFESLMRENRS